MLVAMRTRAAMLAAALLGLAAGGGTSGWQQHSPLPEPRSEVAAAVRDGEIVVIGGFTADGGNSAHVDGYSVRDDRWRRLPDLPAPIDHAAAAGAEGRVYVAGGYGADRVPSRSVFVLAKGGWKRLPPLPDGRAAAAAAVADGTLYVVGGRDERRVLARVAFALKLGSSDWKTIPGPSAREHLAAASSLGRVYAIGGRADGIDTNEKAVEVYDASARRWRRLASLPGARGGTGAAALGGHIVSVGGEQPAGTIRTVYSLDVRKGRWSRLADLPTPRHGLGVVAANHRIWAVAGGPQPGLTVTGTVESLKP